MTPQTTKSESRRPVKVGGYNSSKLQAKRNKRQREADDRQFKYDNLTVAVKVKLAQSRRGESKSELARLAKAS
jgi:hypothetical protein